MGYLEDFHLPLKFCNSVILVSKRCCHPGIRSILKQSLPVTQFLLFCLVLGKQCSANRVAGNGRGMSKDRMPPCDRPSGDVLIQLDHFFEHTDHFSGTVAGWPGANFVVNFLQNTPCLKREPDKKILSSASKNKKKYLRPSNEVILLRRPLLQCTIAYQG